MILSKFVGHGIHGYQDFNLTFNRRLSFLTGINGSGKTTVLNCIQALMNPDLSALQSLVYDSIKLTFIANDGSMAFIEATQSESTVTLNASGSEVKYSYLKYVPDQTLPSFRQADGEIEHYRDLMATSTSHPLMAFISSLPNPMFLGLDRRAKLGLDERRPGMAYRPRAVAGRQLARGMLGTSLNEAEDIVVDAFRDARMSASGVGEELQRQLILSLLTPSQDDFADLALPTETEKRNLIRVRDDLELFPAIFRLPQAEVNRRVRPFLQHLTETLEKIPNNADVSAYFQKHNSPPPYFDSLISWSSSKSQLKKIAVISQMVSSYNERQSASLRPFEDYKKLVNAFLGDSGKSIEIGEDRRSVTVKIKGVKGNKFLSSLSSGEAQIFVILTNLAFSPAAQRANVFIIDEPELSLHLRWQEMFVDSVLSANDSTQFIMATHSPSIILERTSECIDVVAKRRRTRRA